MKKIALLNLLVFLSAFLLFQIELIVAKILLPVYGGSYMVWGACMVFFQAALLVGYCFSHVFLSRMSIEQYRILHIGLMFIVLLFFPGRDIVVGAVGNNVFLAGDVFRQLFFTIGPVFFVLSTISIVGQVWLTQSDLPEQNNPYALYAWSNFGSLAALLTYPFVFEFFFDLSVQIFIWRIGYFLLIGLNLAICFFIPINSVVQQIEEKTVLPHTKELFRWLLLSAGGVVMFLSVTNILTMAIAPFPLLWIIPLGIYLAAFILNFKRVPWCPSWINEHIHLFIGFGVLFYLFEVRQALPIVLQGITLLTLLFIYCMYCQNQLANSCPHGKRNLTVFYLVLALGGFLGGMATTWLVPLVCASVLEFVLGLSLIGFAILPQKPGNPASGFALTAMAILVISLFLWPLAFANNSLLGIILIFTLVMILFNRLNSVQNAFALTMVLIFMLMPALEVLWSLKSYLYKKRNYYGICKIFDYGGVRTFMHGTTLHGMQILDSNLAIQPTSYFGLHSPVGQVLSDESFLADRVGIVGLGAGTLAAYARLGQKIDFYELDQEVYAIANRFFSFVKNSPAQISFFLGDARVELEKNSSVKYDILIIDAFSGDSIPAHLLTKEMLEKCRQHLSKNGVILFHVTNRYLNAGLIVAASARALNAHFCYKSTQQVDFYELYSDWVAVTWSDRSFEKLISQLQWKQKGAQDFLHTHLWTDKYSNILSVIKGGEILNSLKVSY